MNALAMWSFAVACACVGFLFGALVFIEPCGL